MNLEITEWPSVQILTKHATCRKVVKKNFFLEKCLLSSSCKLSINVFEISQQNFPLPT